MYTFPFPSCRLPLLLAAYALTRRGPIAPTEPIVEKTPPYRLIYGSLALVSLTFMFGLPTYALMYALPGINQLNSPFRWIYAVTVCACVFAAFGMDALLRERETKIARRWGLGMIAGAVLMAVELESSQKVLEVIERCLDKGLFTDWFLFAPDCIRIAPPLSMTLREAEKACDILLSCI